MTMTMAISRAYTPGMLSPYPFAAVAGSPVPLPIAPVRVGAGKTVHAGFLAAPTGPVRYVPECAPSTYSAVTATDAPVTCARCRHAAPGRTDKLNGEWCLIDGNRHTGALTDASTVTIGGWTVPVPFRDAAGRFELRRAVSPVTQTDRLRMALARLGRVPAATSGFHTGDGRVWLPVKVHPEASGDVVAPGELVGWVNTLPADFPVVLRGRDGSRFTVASASADGACVRLVGCTSLPLTSRGTAPALRMTDAFGGRARGLYGPWVELTFEPGALVATARESAPVPTPEWL